MKTDEIKVTIWCLAYNHEKYIKKALESFISQKTNFKYEILIHDDASTDKTVQIIEEYRKKYPDIIKPIYEKINMHDKGLDYSINFCIPNAKGKYIAFCEGDDYWVDDYKLQKQYDLMESNPNVSLCVGKTKCTNEDDSHNPTIFPPQEIEEYLSMTVVLSNQNFIKMLFTKCRYPFHTSTYFIRRDVICNNNIYAKLYGLLNGDNRILLSAGAIGDIGYINDVLSNRRLFTKNNWNSRFIKMDDNRKFLYFCNEIKGFLYYRDFLDDKCGDYTNNCICNSILFLANSYNINKVTNFYKSLINVKLPSFATKKERIKFKLFVSHPRIYKLLFVLKRKIDNKYE